MSDEVMPMPMPMAMRYQYKAKLLTYLIPDTRTIF